MSTLAIGEQLQLLQGLGCDQGQGYFFAKPAPPYDSDETHFQVAIALFRSLPQLKSQQHALLAF